MKNSSTILAALIVAVVSGAIPGMVSVYTNKQILISNNEIKKMEISSEERIRKMDHFYNTCSLMRESLVKQEENTKAFIVSDDKISSIMKRKENVPKDIVNNHDLIMNNVLYGVHSLETFLLDGEKNAYYERLDKRKKENEGNYRKWLLGMSDGAMIYIRKKINICNAMGYTLKDDI